MKTNYLLSIILLSAVTLFSSCSPVLYSTVGQNVPMFTEKGEVALQAGYGLSAGNETDADGVALQAAYAVSKSYAIMGSYYSLKGLEEQGSYLGTAPSEWDSKGSYLEAGAGKFGTIKSKPFAWEVFAGLGGGSIKNSMVDAHLDVNILKPFLQPSFGYISKYVDVILTPRIGLVTFTSHSSVLDDPQQSQQSDDFFDRNKNTFVFEPGITIRGGYQRMKIQLQYNYTTFKTDVESDEITFVNKDYVSIGVYFLITGRYNETNTNKE
jgi:hypothetical protein